MIITMTIDVKLDESYLGNGKLDEDSILWLENEILIGNGSLILHSNEVGDEVGVIKKVKNIQYKTP